MSSVTLAGGARQQHAAVWPRRLAAILEVLGALGITLFTIAFALAGDAIVLLGVALLVVALITEFIEKRRLHPRTPAYSAPAA